MTTSVSSSVVAGTWGQANFIWSDPLAQNQSWNSAPTINTFTLAIGETLKCAELHIEKWAPTAQTWAQATMCWTDAGAVSSNWNTVNVPCNNVYAVNADETWATPDGPQFQNTKMLYESWQTHDAYRKHANAVISDLIASSVDMQLSDFQTLLSNGAPPGFSNFVPYMVGDYTYQDALFKVAITSSPSALAELADVSLTVQAVDVLDKGVVTISNAGTITVNFARTFQTNPVVALTLMNGSIGSPNVLSVSTTGFTAQILNASQQPTTGTLSWTAMGY
jgi:hypothetical protein